MRRAQPLTQISKRVSVFARFATMLSLRPNVAGEAAEPPSTACLRVRRWLSLCLDGELADSDQAALIDHLFMRHIESCAACSSFETLAGASTALLRETPLAPHQLPIGVAAADAIAPEDPPRGRGG